MFFTKDDAKNLNKFKAQPTTHEFSTAWKSILSGNVVGNVFNFIFSFIFVLFYVLFINRCFAKIG